MSDLNVVVKTGLEVAPEVLECGECFAEVAVPPGTLSNEIIQCSDCGSDLEVFFNNDGSWELKLAPEDEEDFGE